MDDNLPENSASNTLHFTCPNPTADLPAIETAVTAMYQNMNTFLSSLITPSTWTYKWFDLDDPKPRVPVRTTLNTGPAATGTDAAPPEIAMCISWKAAPASGFPAGRLRNRIYIGPLSKSGLDTNGRPTTTLVTNLVNSADGLLTASQAAGWEWIVFSGTEVAAGFPGVFAISSGWVDNEFDTQRRRGRRPTTRSTFA